MLVFKNCCVVASIFFAISAFANEIIVTTGYGENWGYTAVDDAKIQATELAQKKCGGEVLQITDWNVEILNHKEGWFRATASAEFKCLNEIAP